METWKTLKDHPNYRVSSTGKVESNKTGKYKELRPGKAGNGYLTVNICENGKPVTHPIHRLVAEHFIENPENKRCINHIDGNKLNNNVSNLEWATDKENVRHALDHNLSKPVHWTEEGAQKSIHTRAKPVYIKETGQIFTSVSDCARYLNVNPQAIFAYLNPKDRHYGYKCKGFHIDYVYE